jgi:hypothetical protein
MAAMAKQHPNIDERDWRLRGITTLAQEMRSPSGKSHPAGTPVEVLGFALLPDGNKVNM